jgi:hypothetical protein
VAGFEFHLTSCPIKKIKHLEMQKSEKCGRISANPQPDATRRNQDSGKGQVIEPSLVPLLRFEIKGFALVA